MPTLKYRRHRGDLIETYKIIHGLYDTAVVPNLMMSQVLILEAICISYKKNAIKYDIRKYFLLKELLTCGTLYHPWLSKHRRLIVLRQD